VAVVAVQETISVFLNLALVVLVVQA